MRAPDNKLPEAMKCRPRVLQFLRGHGLDIGYGGFKVTSNAIGVDILEGADVRLDAHKLHIFASDSLNFVFSSHCLEDMDDPGEVLNEWLRVIKPNGYLILYLPHKHLYPNIGSPFANPFHKHDFVPDDIIKYLKQSPYSIKLLRCDTHAEEDEYSFEIVAQKLPGKHKRFEKAIISIPPDAVKILRWGAFGDAVQITPVIKRIKEEGNFVIVETSIRGEQMLKHNPHIDRLEVIPNGALKSHEYQDYWDRQAKYYKRFVNLSGVVEQGLLQIPGKEYGEGYDLPHEERHRRFNKNYIEAYHERAGYQDPGGYVDMEMYFTEEEEAWARRFVKKHSAGYLILWSLAGSGWNKKYPYFEIVARAILDKYRNVTIVSVGDDLCRLLEFKHERLVPRSGRTTIRQSAVLTKYADLVVGPETGILNVAGCFDVPKIIFLSHSSPENLTKYWRNCYNLRPDCDCHPCHRLIYNKEQCPLHYRIDIQHNGRLETRVAVGQKERDRIMAEVKATRPGATVTEMYAVACMATIEPEYLCATIEHVINGGTVNQVAEAAG